MTAVESTLSDLLRDRYLIERELGRGGMATVWLARDLRHDRLVALKVMHPELARALGPERFLREIRTTARLDHPHILPLLDSGEAAGHLWYTMPYIKGESLRERLRREIQLPVEEVVRLAREVAEALDCAHRAGVIHRDVKPENILLSEGHARVADFGVARALEAAGAGHLTETGIAVGTPAYMSPEQATAGSVDARTDVYALGCVLYEMLAGEPPFTGPTPQSIVARRLTEDPRPLSATRERVPAHVEAAVVRALARAPADRFSTAAEFGAALGEGAPHRTNATRPGLRPTRSRVLGLISGLALTAALGSYAFWQRSPSSRAGGPPAAGSGSGVNSGTPAAASIAVLPFSNLSSDRENEYFSDGMAEELIDGLAHVSGLRVAARTSSFAFKGKDVDVREVGAKLGVGHVLEGSVRRSGDAVRVTAQLIDAANGYHVWSQTFDRELRDVLALQDELARAIVSALELRLTGDSVIIQPGTNDPEAHDLYLKGRYFWNRPAEPTLRKAVDYFQRALARDSTYALAYSGLADAYYLLGAHGYVPPSEVLPHSKVAARKALALDSTLAESHISLASVARWWDQDRELAEQHFQRAVALDPRYPEAYRFHSWLLVDRLDTAGAIREMRRAQALDPLSPLISGQLGSMFMYARQYDSALARYRTLLELDSTFPGTHRALGVIYTRLGRFDDAFREMEIVASDARAKEDYRTHLAYLDLYVAAGRRTEAEKALQAIHQIARRRYIRAGTFAGAYALLSDRERAFAWLERGVRERSLGPQLKAERAFESLHSDPRWGRILAAMHLND